jgi:hypothetical protein
MTGRERALVLTALWIASGGGATWAVPSKSYYRSHELHSLDYRVAETLAWEICRSVGSTDKDPCKVDSSSDHKLVLLGPAEAHARLVEILAERDPVGRPAQRFEVYLLRGREGKEPAAIASLPAGVAAALSGLREFLPSTGFEILASGALETSGRAEVQLAGKGDEKYLIALDYRGRRTGRGPATLFVDVTVTPVGAGQRPDDARRLVSNSLTIDAGETVVVGSSGGPPRDQELLVLLLSAAD